LLIFLLLLFLITMFGLYPVMRLRMIRAYTPNAHNFTAWYLIKQGKI